jgi:hypothetical protein
MGTRRSTGVCYNPPEILGDLMTDLLNMLHEERACLLRKLAAVDAAIHALNGSNVATVIAAVTGVKAGKKRKWKMSAAARANISAAQKKRWAKIKR